MQFARHRLRMVQCGHDGIQRRSRDPIADQPIDDLGSLFINRKIRIDTVSVNRKTDCFAATGLIT